LHAQKKRNKEKGATKTAIPTRANRSSRTFPERPHFSWTSAALETSGKNESHLSLLNKSFFSQRFLRTVVIQDSKFNFKFRLFDIKHTGVDSNDYCAYAH
jgi:hypothetical protein